MASARSHWKAGGQRATARSGAAPCTARAAQGRSPPVIDRLPRAWPSRTRRLGMPDGAPDGHQADAARPCLEIPPPPLANRKARAPAGQGGPADFAGPPLIAAGVGRSFRPADPRADSDRQNGRRSIAPLRSRARERVRTVENGGCPRGTTLPVRMDAAAFHVFRGSMLHDRPIVFCFDRPGLGSIRSPSVKSRRPQPFRRAWFREFRLVHELIRISSTLRGHCPANAHV